MSRYVPPSHPIVRKAARDNTPELRPPTLPEVVEPSDPLIDLDNFERELFRASPAEQLPLIGRYFEKSRLDAAADRVGAQTKLFKMLRAFYSESASAFGDRRNFDLKVREAIASTRHEIEIGKKRRELDHANLDAEIAAAKRRKRDAEDD